MKLFSLFTLFGKFFYQSWLDGVSIQINIIRVKKKISAASSAGMIEIWDENGMVAYVDENERGSAVFGVPDKGPRECAGKKIPMVKHGKQYIS